MPLTDDGRDRLAVELGRASELVDPPALVWLFCRDHLRERRGALYGWRDGPPRRALVVWHESPLRDRVEWLCAPCIRHRAE